MDYIPFLGMVLHLCTYIQLFDKYYPYALNQNHHLIIFFNARAPTNHLTLSFWRQERQQLTQSSVFLVELSLPFPNGISNVYDSHLERGDSFPPRVKICVCSIYKVATARLGLMEIWM